MTEGARITVNSAQTDNRVSDNIGIEADYLSLSGDSALECRIINIDELSLTDSAHAHLKQAGTEKITLSDDSTLNIINDIADNSYAAAAVTCEQ